MYYGAGRSEAAQCGDDDVVVIGAHGSAHLEAVTMADADGVEETLPARALFVCIGAQPPERPYSDSGSFGATTAGSAAARFLAAFLAALISRRSWSARSRLSLAIVVFRLPVDAM